MMLPKVGRYRNVAEPFHCDIHKELFLGHLGNHLLNAADFHSNDRGFGVSYLQTISRTWVLSRLVVEMQRMPSIYDEFYVETWVESAMRYFTNRNFHIEDRDGNTLGYGRSIWAMIDIGTRRPANILDVNDGEIESWIETERENPIERPSRVMMSHDAAFAGEIVARYSDVDINGHVNSVKYIEHLLDLIPMDVYRTKFIKRFDIAYVAESYGGDTLRFYADHADGSDDYMYRVCKVTSDGETECVRTHIRFENRK